MFSAILTWIVFPYYSIAPPTFPDSDYEVDDMDVSGVFDDLDDDEVGRSEFEVGSDGADLLSRTTNEIQDVVNEGTALLRLMDASRKKRRMEDISEGKAADATQFDRVQLVPIESSLAIAAAAVGDDDSFGDLDDP
jgi:hypothetical protein